MRILLCNPPWRIGDRVGVRAGSRWPFTLKEESKTLGYCPFPFFLAYATAILEKNGYEVLLIDAIAEGMSKKDFLNKVKKFSPNLTVLETSTPSWYTDLEYAKLIKSLTHSQIAFCGSHATVFPQETLKNDFVDYVLVGEYEYTLLDLVKHLKKGKELKNVLGLAYKQNGKIRINERRPLIKNIDKLPWPARHFLPIYNYKDPFAELPQPPLIMWASRGCPFRCIFCLWPATMYGRNHIYRVREPVKVVDEIEYCIQTYPKLRSIYFDDDTFNLGKERIILLCNELKKRKIDLPWAVMARADTSDKETLLAMKKAGLYAVKYGIESGDQQLLNNAHKALNLKKAKKVIRITKKLGIKVHLTFTVGLPGETWKTVEKTLKFIKETSPNSIQVSIVTPFPGTEYYEMLESKGLIITNDWKKYDGNSGAVFNLETMSGKELEMACEYLKKEWKKYQIKKNLLKYLIKGLKNPFEAIEKIKELYT